MRKRAEIAVFGTIAFSGVVVALAVAATHGIAGPRLNFTPSVPVGLYFYEPGAVKRGDIVQVCLPMQLAAFSLAMKYDYPVVGPCASGVAPLVKVLAALPGDDVAIEERTLRVNGAPWPMSQIRSIDSRGRRVTMRLPIGAYRIAPAHMLLLGLHPDSWDGRYFGALPSSAVTGRWIPLLVARQKDRL